VRLKGKVAIVTGGGSGIGRACARAFIREGAKVAVVGRREEPLQEVVRELGTAAMAICADVSRRDDIQRIAGETAARFGSVQVLVNSAGVLLPGTAESQTEQEWDETFNVNVRGLWMLSRGVIPAMREAGGGSIINVASVVGQMGARSRAAYGASKGAVIALTKCMAMDLGPERIRVNCICPGIVETELVARLMAKMADPEAVMRERLSLHPIGRFGQPEDVAESAVYLAGDESSWVTGSALVVDGGYTAGRI
jgi:NAD(P)-dependent dehydrogenase (short-subunit alcohol dehydrogenase family)